MLARFLADLGLVLTAVYWAWAVPAKSRASWAAEASRLRMAVE